MKTTKTERRELVQLQAELLCTDGFNTLTFHQIRRIGEILTGFVKRGIKVESILIHNGCTFIESLDPVCKAQVFEIVDPQGRHSHVGV